MLGRTSSSTPVRRAIYAAAVSVTALLSAAGISHAQQPRLETNVNLVAPVQSFTPDECRSIRVAATMLFKRVGANNLSLEFRQSMVRFIAPDGQHATCDGPKVISWRTQEDAATFNSIRGVLLASDTSAISLERAGVALAPSPLASLKLQ